MVHLGQSGLRASTLMDFVECNHVEVRIIGFVVLVVEHYLHLIQLQLNLLDLRENEVTGELPYVFLAL